MKRIKDSEQFNGPATENNLQDQEGTWKQMNFQQYKESATQSPQL